MKTSTTAWTAAIVVMSVQGPFAAAEAAPAQNLQQEAEPERPKYYFPRHVKRAYPNVTSSSKTTLSSLLAALTDNDPNTNLFNPRPSTDSTTTDGQTDVLSQLTSSITEPASVPADASGTTPKPSNSTSTEPTTTGGLLDLGSLFGPTSSDDVKTKISEQPNTTDATTTEPAGQPSANNTITTVTLDEPAYSPTSTTANGGGLLGSGGLLGPILQPSRTSSSIVQPTYVSEDSAPNGTELDPQPAASGSGGAPYNEVSPTAPASTEAALSGPTNTSTGPVLVGLSTVIDNAAPTTTSESGGLLDPLLSALKPEPTPTSSTYAQGTGSDGTAPVIVQPTGSSVPNTTTKDSPGLLDPLLSGLKSEPTPTGSTYAQGTGSEGTAPVIVQPTGSSVPNATTTDSPGLLDSLLSPTPTDSSIGSVVSSMSSQVSSVSSTDALSGLASTLSSQLSSIVATNPAVSSSLSSEFSGILSSAASSLVSSSASNTATIIGTGISTGSYSLSTSGASVVPIPVGTVSSTIPSNATVTASSESTATPTSGLTTYASASTSSSSLVMPSISVPGNSSSTLTATGLVPTITSSTLSLPSYESSSSTSTASSVSSTSEPIPTSSSAIATTSAPSTTSTSQPPASLVPTGTDTATTMSIPSSIIFAPTSTSTAATLTSVESGSTTSSTHTGMPSAMPRLVQPPGGMPKSPANTTLIQVGFNYGLNFPFVVSTDNSASQIFTYLPKGIAYALGISNDKVVMNALMPYDTTKSLNFITTLAQAYIPSDMVSQLQLDLHTQMSKAYSNPDDAVHTLMSMINPTIPILPGANMDQGYGTPSENPAATAPGSGGDGAPIGGDSGSSQAVNGTSVGIGLGAVAGAAVYAAAMVYVARRYRKKRASHKRASSVQGTSDMAQRSPAALSGGMGGYFMSGANGARGGPSRQSSYGSGGRDSRQSDGSSNNRSVREQGISAPISHGNSLGWD